MTTQTIKKDIEAYLSAAKPLEEKRRVIERQLKSNLPDIVQLVERDLPEGYNLNSKRTRVDFSPEMGYPGGVPLNISVHLELEHCHQPIGYSDREVEEHIAPVVRALHPLLLELRNYYGVGVKIIGQQRRVG